VDRFNICQAYLQLESDYNVGGWLRERPSNQRRREGICVQLQRMGYQDPYRWVTIEDYPPSSAENGDCDDDEVREIYMCAVLRLDLPIDEDLMAAMRRYFTADFMAKYPQTRGVSYKQGD